MTRTGKDDRHSPRESPRPADTKSVSLSALQDRLLRGGVWVVGSRLVGIGLAFAAGVTLARRLNPGDFGYFLLTISIVRFAVIPARFGLDRALVRFIASDLALGRVGRVRQTLGNSLKIAAWSSSLACGFCVLFLGLLGGLLFQLPGTTEYLIVCGTTLLLLTAIQLIAEAFRGFHELRYASLFDGQNSAPLINLVFLGLLQRYQPEETTLQLCLGLYAVSVGAVLPAAVALLLRVTRARLASTNSDSISAAESSDAVPQGVWPCVIAFGLPAIAVSQLFAFTSTQADLWIAGAFVEGDALALYGAARQLMNLVALPLSMLSLVVVSMIPELHARNQRLKLQRVLQTTALVAAVPSLAALGILLLAPQSILTTVFGPFYSQASPYLVILCLGQIVFVLTGSCGHSLILTGHHRVVVWTRFVFAVALLSLGSLAARRFGLTGLAIVSAVTLAASNLTLWWLAYRKLGVWTHATFDTSILKGRSLRAPPSTAEL